jgi:hypothetical protein
MNTKPLTLEEVFEAADIFFPIYEHIKHRLPADTKVEDVLKVAENVCTLAHKLRTEKEAEALPFGFNKKPNDGQETD